MGHHENLPEGTRTHEEFTVKIPGTNVTFSNTPLEEPPWETLKRRWQTHLGLDPVIGDPNDCSAHTDVIKEKLIAKAKDANASDTEREQAQQMLNQFYPYTEPADPNRWQGQGNIMGGVITNTKGAALDVEVI